MANSMFEDQPLTGGRKIEGAAGTVWVEIKKGLFVPQTSFDAYRAARQRREDSQAYLKELQVQGVRLPRQ